MTYTRTTTTDAPFDDAVTVVTTALQDEGFGVLCDIDVQATLKEKLGEEFRRYRVLKACNPGLANEGLNEEIELGALPPCNVIVYETSDGEIKVSAVDPKQLVGIADDQALDSIATEVREGFERVLTSVAEELESQVEE